MVRAGLGFVVAVALTMACGTENSPDEGVPKTGTPKQRSTNELFTANDHTPGFFRDTYRMLLAQSVVDDTTATNRLLLDLPARLASPGELPALEPVERATMDALLMLGLRSTQALAASPNAARSAGERAVALAAALDPARDAWNAAHPQAVPVETTSAGAEILAFAAVQALERAGAGTPALCKVSALTEGTARWDQGQPEIVWVDERCEPDRFVGGYCESDRWVEGECYDRWVAESCSGGQWRDQGYYEYRCYSDNDCRYIWRQRWVYLEGVCSGGYYEEDCYSGHMEEGLCYEGTWQPGHCIPGHYEHRYPGGTWSFEDYAQTPRECTAFRPSQTAIAVSFVQIVHAQLRDALEPEPQAMVDALVASNELDDPTDGVIAAVTAILELLGQSVNF